MHHQGRGESLRTWSVATSEIQHNSEALLNDYWKSLFSVGTITPAKFLVGNRHLRPKGIPASGQLAEEKCAIRTGMQCHDQTNLWIEFCHVFDFKFINAYCGLLLLCFLRLENVCMIE